MLLENKDVPAYWKSDQEMESTKDKVIHLTELRRYGYLIELHAFISKVKYFNDEGIEVFAYVENDDFRLVEEELFIYERE